MLIVSLRSFLCKLWKMTYATLFEPFTTVEGMSTNTNIILRWPWTVPVPFRFFVFTPSNIYASKLYKNEAIWGCLFLSVVVVIGWTGLSATTLFLLQMWSRIGLEIHLFGPTSWWVVIFAEDQHLLQEQLRSRPRWWYKARFLHQYHVIIIVIQ